MKSNNSKIESSENLEKCIRDLQKILEAEKLMSCLEQMNAKDSNIKQYLDYILKNNIVKNLEDVFYIVSKVPNISKQFSECIEKSEKRGNLVKLEPKVIVEYTNRSPSGSYNSLSEVPGFGTEWNERCIPDGVSIRGRGNNSRC